MYQKDHVQYHQDQPQELSLTKMKTQLILMMMMMMMMMMMIDDDDDDDDKTRKSN